jgi:hypothetical protein
VCRLVPPFAKIFDIRLWISPESRIDLDAFGVDCPIRLIDLNGSEAATTFATACVITAITTAVAVVV